MKLQPIWLNRKEVLARYHIPIRHLDLAVGDGLIRTVKFGEQRQSTRLYRDCDLESWLGALSEGKTPKSRC